MRRIGFRSQRTLAAPAVVAGRGFVTGGLVTARLVPAGPGCGVRFVRTDRPGRPATPARADAVTATRRRTTVGPAADGVTLVEHLLAALAGLRVDNCMVELDGPEPPGLDGSAAGYVRAVRAAGVVAQPAARPIYTVDRPVVRADGGATVAVYPADPARPAHLRISYRLDYGPGSPIPPQAFTLTADPAGFARDVAGCRTFLLEPEADDLRAAGVGRHLTPADVLVFGRRGPVANRLRFADEPARHKVVDLVGDLALCGFDLAGHVVGYRSGHALNVALAADLASRACGGAARAA